MVNYHLQMQRSNSKYPLRFHGYLSRGEDMTLGQRVRLAMVSAGMGIGENDQPAAALYNLWKETYGETASTTKDSLDYITRQAFHEWLNSDDKIPPITSHKLFRLADMLNVSPRWMMYGEHLGAVSMESLKSMDEREQKLLDHYRLLPPEGQERLYDRSKDLLDMYPPKPPVRKLRTS